MGVKRKGNARWQRYTTGPACRPLGSRHPSAVCLYRHLGWGDIGPGLHWRTDVDCAPPEGVVRLKPQRREPFQWVKFPLITRYPQRATRLFASDGSTEKRGVLLEISVVNKYIEPGASILSFRLRRPSKPLRMCPSSSTLLQSSMATL